MCLVQNGPRDPELVQIFKNQRKFGRKCQKLGQILKNPLYGKYFENNQFKLPFYVLEHVLLKFFLHFFSKYFSLHLIFQILNFLTKKLDFFYFRILVEFFVRVGWIKILVRSRSLGGVEERKEESRWCSSAKSETQRIIRKEIKSDSPIYCTIVLCSGKRTSSHNMHWRYCLESGWFQSFFLKIFTAWKTIE